MPVLPALRLPKGFTLVELLVAVVVVSLLASLALPGFRDLIRSSQRDSASYSLLGDLVFARSEAIKRSNRLAVCARATGQTPSCSTANAPDWSQGWLIFTDDGDDAGTLDTDSGEALLRVSDPVGNPLAISNKARTSSGATPPAARSSIAFGPRGTSDWRGGGTFLVCDADGNTAARNASAVGLNITLSGDVRRARRGSNGALIDAFGTTASCP